ncbi:hypothetical protein niasHT_035208 [Heterodera trifolii]|uniref:Ribokinase n=1 Tax=Heterodera trifolii TaxID=157864 RepID=A0ABD2IVK9_9BILA
MTSTSPPLTNGVANHLAENGSATSPELIVFGSIVQDLVSYVDRFPKPGESVRGHTFKTFCGGKGANQAVMASRMGTRVAMVGMVGDDLFAAENVRSIAQNGVDVSLVKQLPGQTTGTATITVSGDGENCIVVTLGANTSLGAECALAIEHTVARARLVLCQQEIDQQGTLTVFRIAKRHGVTTFFNPAPGRADIDRTILPLCDIICTNENEAEFLTHLPMENTEQAKVAALRILEMGPRVAIVTLGPRGAIVARREHNNGHVKIGEVSAPKVTAVDTTGAGDCFCGALAHFLVSQPSAELLEDHVRRAVQIAALSVQKKGTQASYPTRDELITMRILQG